MSDEKLPWFRMYSEIIDDDRIELLAFEDQRHYVWLLCLKNEGILDKDYGDTKLRERVIAKKLGLDIEKLRDLKARLTDIGIIDDDWQPKGWDKKQYVSDNSTARVRRHRERQAKRKAEEQADSKTIEESGTKDDETFQKRFSNGDVTAPDNRIQINPSTNVLGAQVPADSVDNPPDLSTTPVDLKPPGEAPTVWDVWLSIPGVKAGERSARAHLGKLIKRYGERAVGRAVAETSLQKPADPNAFVEKLLQQNPKGGKREPWQKMPANNDNSLVAWAKQHGFSKPRAGEEWPAYRNRLKVEVDQRLNPQRAPP